MERIKSLQIKLSPELYDLLNKICTERGITRSQYLKGTIKKHLQLLLEPEEKKDIIFTGFDRNDFYKMYPNRQLFRDKFYISPEWGEISLEVLNRDNYTCQICGRKPSRNVHHKRDAFSFPEMCLSLNNLITLCDKHHNEWHNR